MAGAWTSGHKKKRAREKETWEGRGSPRVSPSRAPVLSFATTSKRLLRRLVAGLSLDPIDRGPFGHLMEFTQGSFPNPNLYKAVLTPSTTFTD